MSEVGANSPPAVLVVDDHEMVLRVVAKMLRKLGLVVLVATSAREAVRILAEKKVSMVLSDVRMPGMTGTELAWHVRTHHPDVSMALMTAYTDATDGERPFGVAVLQKPFLGSDLERFVRERLPDFDLVPTSESDPTVG